jgi:hypothetical protein
MKALFLACLTLVVTSSGFAQDTKQMVRKGEYYVGSATNTPQCPAIRYLFRDISAKPVGYVWFADASGMSKATGTLDMASGQFHLTVTPIDGSGPIGEVTGTKNPDTGVVTAELEGPGCSKLKLGPTNPYFRRADGTD